MDRRNARYRDSLPQLGGQRFVTDGGLETTLVFHDGIELPAFAAFHLLRDAAGERRLRDYYERYIAIAKRHGLGFVLESATWRANPDWGRAIGYEPEELDRMNRKAIDLLHALREAHGRELTMVISGCIGPRGDGYDPATLMEVPEAAAYHGRQIEVFERAGVDLVSAITMTNAAEAAGIVTAARAHRVPSVISFTVETDGRLPTGQALRDAIEEVDERTDGGPAYYMINCAHPSHFEDAIASGTWRSRIRGLRANASKCSHAELDEAEELDDGNPAELGRDHRRLLACLPKLSVLGGCCGTDHRHVASIVAACAGWTSAADSACAA